MPQQHANAKSSFSTILLQDSPNDYKRFTETFVNILKQIIEFRLPNEFTYYNVPAPWIQIKLFKILAILGNDDQRYISTHGVVHRTLFSQGLLKFIAQATAEFLNSLSMYSVQHDYI